MSENNINNSNDNNNDDYEKICYICRRPESKAGKMISMHNNIYVCSDCMQRTFDSINNSGFNYDDIMKMYNMPGFGNMSFNNMNDINTDIPNKQKIKKKKSTEKKKEDKIDLRNIPAPHEIKHMLDEYVVGQD